MKELYKKLLVYGGSSLGMLGVGAGVTAGIVVPKALKAKAILEDTYLSGGSAADLKGSLAKNKELKVVALGDSVTAGYNGLFAPADADGHTSYADYLVEALRKSGTKVNYKNFAKSGLRLTDFLRQIESGEVTRELHGHDVPLPAGQSDFAKGADIITLTIGANDLMAYLKLFNIPFQEGAALLGNMKDIISKYNIANDGTFGNFDWDKILKSEKYGAINAKNSIRKDKDTNFAVNRDSSNLVWNSIYEIMDITKGNPSHFLNLDHNFVTKVFDLIKQKLNQALHMLHLMAPKAQIVVMGPTFPFAQLPKNVLTTKNGTSGNVTIMELFNKLLDAMKDATKLTVDGNSADFVSFYKADELDTVKDYTISLQDIYKDPSHLVKGTKMHPIDYTDEAKFKASILNQVNPNIIDIHPTVFGHKLIGEGLFRILAKQIGISEDKVNEGVEAVKNDHNDEDTKNNSNLVNIYKAAKTQNTLFTGIPQIPGDIAQYLYFMINDKLIDNPLFKDSKYYGYKLFYTGADKKADIALSVAEMKAKDKKRIDGLPTTKTKFDAWYEAGIKNLIKEATTLGTDASKGLVNTIKKGIKSKLGTSDDALAKLDGEDAQKKLFGMITPKIADLETELIKSSKAAAFVLRRTYDFTVKHEKDKSTSDYDYATNSYAGVASYVGVVQSFSTTLATELGKLLTANAAALMKLLS